MEVYREIWSENPENESPIYIINDARRNPRIFSVWLRQGEDKLGQIRLLKDSSHIWQVETFHIPPDEHMREIAVALLRKSAKLIGPDQSISMAIVDQGVVAFLKERYATCVYNPGDEFRVPVKDIPNFPIAEMMISAGILPIELRIFNDSKADTPSLARLTFSVELNGITPSTQ